MLNSLGFGIIQEAFGIANKSLGANVPKETKEQVKDLITKDKDVVDVIRKVANDEIRRYNNNQHSGIIDYNMLTSGNVNMSDRATPSNITTYGSVSLAGTPDSYGNQDLYTKMKNKINYGHSTDRIAINRGSISIV